VAFLGGVTLILTRWPCVLFVALLGCNGSAVTPVSPTPPAVPPPPGPSASFLVIDATSIGRGTQAALVAGQSHQMRVRGSTPQGFLEVDAAWHSDNPAVLTSTPQGRITGIANGWATLVAVYSGVNAAINVRVATDYGGEWPGALRLIGCQSPDASYCARYFPPGTRRPLQLSVIMDRLFAVVRFRWDLDGIPLMLTNTVEVGLDASLAFAGGTYDSRGFEAPLVVAGWRSELTAPDRMTGRVTLIHGLRDPARTEWELVDVTRAR
jgi:hypothetical protein